MHALITEGVFHATADGGAEFERVEWWDQRALSELFRRMVLRSLREAERLRPETEETLLGWQHSGFHVHAGEAVLPDDKDRQEHLARSITRAPLRLDAVRFTEDRERVKVRTPPDPQSGRTVMELDRLELIRRLCTQIPAPDGRSAARATTRTPRAADECESRGRGGIESTIRRLSLVNARKGRTDRRGSLRFAIGMASIFVIAEALRSHLLKGQWFLEEIWLLLCGSVFIGTLIWVIYSAIEPVGRQVWPTMFVSSSRLLSRERIVWGTPCWTAPSWPS